MSGAQAHSFRQKKRFIGAYYNDTKWRLVAWR
jgi:hypothetical protein